MKSAKQYHDTTSYERNRPGGHMMDWKNQPLLFKEYKGMMNTPLPESAIPSEISLKSIGKTAADSAAEPMDIKKISTILRLTYSITAESRFSRGIYYYRSAASAGALYPVEIYLTMRDSEGLEDGLYHYNILNQSLVRLRKGNFSEYAGNITVPRSKGKPVISFIFSSIFFRSSWKYRDRAYRYHLLDTGHVLENLALALRVLKIPFEIFYDFHDDTLDELIGIDGFREASFAVINVPGDNILEMDKCPDISPLSNDVKEASIMSGNDMDYPEVREIHEAGKSLSSRERPWDSFSKLSTPSEKWKDIDPADELPKSIPYPESLFARRSKRNFVNEMIGQNDFMTILDLLTDNSNKGAGKGKGRELLQTAFFAENVKDISPGLYSLDTAGGRFGLLQEGVYGGMIAHICLNQEWLKNAGLHFLIIGNLDQIDKTYGSRGYRYAMMEAGRIGQKLYISATSLGLGCCGIGAFYDSEAAELLNCDEDNRLLYLVALGKIKR